MAWPENKRFAFTIFDDTDNATLENVSEVYALLGDLGLRTTKSAWPVRHTSSEPREGGVSCEDDPEYLAWLRGLQQQGFEVGWHNAACSTSTRERTRYGLEQFRQLFGDYPRTMANHTGCNEGIYWGEARLHGVGRAVYSLLTSHSRRGKYRGHVEGDELFWGDYCRQYLRYVRNFVFADVNTLKCCPFMPYYDDRTPYVNYWFASSEGGQVNSFTARLDEAAQDRLEDEGGACIMYTHFARGFYEHGVLDARFRRLMERLARKGGWFVPVTVLLDFLRERGGHHEITPTERALLELRWLMDKVFVLGPT